MNRVAALFFSAFIFFFVSCKSNKKDKPYAETENIFLNYKITANEGDDMLTVFLQYRDGEDGDGLSINEPGKVTLDGEQVPKDSTKMSGYFYETYKPIETFAGTHHIVFITDNSRQYKEDFVFKKFSLLTPVADTIHRGELVFQFDGLNPDDRIRVLMTDTSFINDGINRVDNASDGRIVITANELENLANGPVQLEFIREYEEPVKNGPKEGGRFRAAYSLRREFILVD